MLVLTIIGFPEVYPSVVRPDSIDVIQSFLGPLSGVQSPRETVSSITLAVVVNRDVAVFINAFCNSTGIYASYWFD